MKKTNIVATYDYFSRQQVEQIIHEERAEAVRLERKRVARKKRKDRQENISAILYSLIMMLFVFGMIIFWIKFGYII